MADKNGRERLSLYFNTKNEKEASMWEYIEEKFSKSAFVKEAIEEKMLREKTGVTLTQLVKESKANEIKEKTKLDKKKIDTDFLSM